MNIFRLFLAMLTIAMLLAGCGKPATTTQQQTADGLTIALELPQQAEVLKEYTLIVTLTDAGGKPVDGASVYFDMTMQAMAMAPQTPLADPLGNGRYGATTLFTMEGNWKIVVHADAGGKSHQATFDQPVILPQ